MIMTISPVTVGTLRKLQTDPEAQLIEAATGTANFLERFTESNFFTETFPVLADQMVIYSRELREALAAIEQRDNREIGDDQ